MFWVLVWLEREKFGDLEKIGNLSDGFCGGSSEEEGREGLRSPFFFFFFCFSDDREKAREKEEDKSEPEEYLLFSIYLYFSIKKRRVNLYELTY